MILLTSIIGSQTFAQDFFLATTTKLEAERIKKAKEERAREVMQDNEYKATGAELGNFFSNPLLLNGKPLDYAKFSLMSEGELTLVKGSVITGDTTQVPFRAYLRRNGKQVFILGGGSRDPRQLKLDVYEILKHAEEGDLLVIEPINKEDGHAKRILKLLEGGC